MSQWFSELHAKFILDFVEKQRWMYIVDGLKITLLVTALSVVLGLAIGAVIAVIRTTHDQLREENISGIGKKIVDGTATVQELE